MPRKPVGIACNESVAVACEESVHSVAEQNQRLPKAKPFCRGYMPDVPSPFVQNWAFAAHKVDLVNGAKKKPGQVESNCPFAYIELWEKVQLPMQYMHQQTCSMSSNMPEHNRDCMPLCVGATTTQTKCSLFTQVKN